eukprot:Skav208063  [mRNA]  locus=scaffold936:54634:57360:- [translate_table: standard]
MSNARASSVEGATIASSFTDVDSCAAAAGLTVLRPHSSSSATSIFSTDADSLAANAHVVDDYISKMELFVADAQEPPDGRREHCTSCCGHGNGQQPD